MYLLCVHKKSTTPTRWPFPLLAKMMMAKEKIHWQSLRSDVSRTQARGERTTPLKWALNLDTHRRLLCKAVPRSTTNEKTDSSQWVALSMLLFLQVTLPDLTYCLFTLLFNLLSRRWWRWFFELCARLMEYKWGRFRCNSGQEGTVANSLLLSQQHLLLICR